MRTLRACCVTAVMAGCGGGSPPEIHGLADQVATVGQELVVNVDGSDPDGDLLTYGVHADLSLQGTAMLTQAPSGMGVFRWTPLAADIGTHAFDFSVSDGTNTTTVSIMIDVRSAVGAAPIFRQPLGTGSVVDLAQTPCANLTIVVEDQDSPTVTIAQEDPVITGATLTVIDGQNATWKWCPTPKQVMDADRYTVVLSANDGENPPTIKNYVLVLGGGSSTAHVVINEVDYDNVGTDNAEYIELFNPSGTSASLAGLQLVLVNGATGTAYDTVDLSPVQTLGPGEYLVIGGSMVLVPASAKKLDPVWSLDQIQNGSPDGIALVDSVTHTLIDALSYEGSISMAQITGFPAAVSLVEGTVLPTQTQDSNTATRTLCRNPNGTDTNNAASDWTECTQLTPGTANAP